MASNHSVWCSAIPGSRAAIKQRLHASKTAQGCETQPLDVCQTISPIGRSALFVSVEYASM